MVKPITEKSLIPWMGLSIVFMLLVFSEQFGTVYIALTFVWFMFLMLDKGGRRYPIERNPKKRGEAVIIAIIFYAVFLIISSVVMTSFGVIAPEATIGQSVKSVINMMGAGMLQAAKPAYAGSVILLFIGFTVIVGPVETITICARVFESLQDNLTKKGFNFRKITLALLILFMFIGAIAVGTHLSSKGTSTELLVTFLFFSLSAWVIWIRKQSLEMIFAHILGNGVAILVQLNVI